MPLHQPAHLCCFLIARICLILSCLPFSGPLPVTPFRETGGNLMSLKFLISIREGSLSCGILHFPDNLYFVRICGKNNENDCKTHIKGFICI